MRKLFFIVLGLSLLINSCSFCSKSSGCQKVDPLQAVAYFGANDKYKCVVPVITLNIPARDSLKVVERLEYSIVFYKYDNIAKRNNESKFDGLVKPFYADYPISEDSLKRTIYAVIPLDIEKSTIGFDSAKLGTKIKYNNTAYVTSDVSISNANGDKSMLLIPSVKRLRESVYELNINSIRLALRENEYLPSSETMRVRIISANGRKPIWSSNEGMNYMAVIMKVEPENIGDTFIHSFVLDKLSDNVKSMTSGKYYLNFLIPAKPEIISTEIECYLDK